MRHRSCGLWLSLAADPDNAEFDLDGDGTDEPARVSAVFTR